jgi:hypothetical protein
LLFTAGIVKEIILMFQITDSVFQTPDPVWHETHLLDEKPYFDTQIPNPNNEDNEISAERKQFSRRERIMLKCGSILILIGNGLVGRVTKPVCEPQTI